MRLWPRRLLGQMLLAVALALLVAQAISVALLWRAADARRDQEALNNAAIRLVYDRPVPGPDHSRGADRPPPPERLRMRLPRSIQLELAATTPVGAGEQRILRLEDDLRAMLASQGVSAESLVVVVRDPRRDPLIRQHPKILQRIARGPGEPPELLVVGLKRTGEAQWRIARVIKPPPPPGALWTLLVQTLIIYLVLVGLHFLLLRRITRPLAALTRRTERIGHGDSAGPALAAEGPEDISQLIAAHNAMEARIGALLDEKDVMLGAIGHDLKTPLAALRVRIESVEDDRERGKMAATIEDISRSLDDILTLARVGRTREPPERAELSALVASVVEEFEDMGAAVTAGPAERIVGTVHVTWLRRALRNLIDNALRYGDHAEVSLLRDGTEAVLRVDDHGPGIPPDRIEAMLEPFARGESSRNRETGGAGLGLALARAIAEQHRGRLVLANRPAGGLSAELRLPLAG